MPNTPKNPYRQNNYWREILHRINKHNRVRYFHTAEEDGLGYFATIYEGRGPEGPPLVTIGNGGNEPGFIWMRPGWTKIWRTLRYFMPLGLEPCSNGEFLITTMRVQGYSPRECSFVFYLKPNQFGHLDRVTNCPNCNRSMNPKWTSDGLKIICLQCHGWSYCPVCGNRVRIRPGQGHTICTDCQGQGWCNCQECHEPVQNSPCCSRCQPIQNYGFKPKPVFYGTGKPLLGVENEVEIRGATNTELSVHARRVREQSGDFYYTKHDGSLDHGFEVVSHPASLDFWRTDKRVDPIFTLKENGAKSWDTTTCGMHIHMSKEHFTYAQIYKMLKLLSSNEEWLFIMSQRKDIDEMNSWATADPATRRDMVGWAKGERKPGSRRRALNLQPDKTMEIRMFKGTLNRRTFFKNLEFAQCAYEYTAAVPFTRIGKDSYMEYALKHSGDFPELATFITGKELLCAS